MSERTQRCRGEGVVTRVSDEETEPTLGIDRKGLLLAVVIGDVVVCFERDY